MTGDASRLELFMARLGWVRYARYEKLRDIATEQVTAWNAFKVEYTAWIDYVQRVAPVHAVRNRHAMPTALNHGRTTAVTDELSNVINLSERRK